MYKKIMECDATISKLMREMQDNRNKKMHVKLNEQKK